MSRTSSFPNIADAISRERAEQLLRIRGEGDAWDFKLLIALENKHAFADVARDIIAMANSGGGHLLFGVDPKTYEIVGIENSEAFDTTKIGDALSRFTNAALQFGAAVYRFPTTSGGVANIGIFYVAAFAGVAMPAAVVNSPIPGRKNPVMTPTDILVRSRASTRLADQGSLERLIGNLRRQPANEFDDKPPRPAIHNLPAREDVAPDFVGRTEELAHLWGWLLDPLRRRYLLAGDGGKGKSAIAYEFSAQVVSVNPPNLVGVIWLSAKRKEFVQGRIRERHDADFNDMETMLDAILSETGFPELCARPPQEKRKRVVEHLNFIPILLIVDDIDSLENDDAIEFLALDAASTKSKVLLTSRRIPYGLATSSLQVRGLAFDDGVKFVRSRAKLLGLADDEISESALKAILEATDGSPLYIEDLLRYCKVKSMDSAIQLWLSKGGDPARRYALEREFDKLSRGAREVVVACCLMSGPTSFAELRAITEHSEDDLHQEMEAIHSLFLIGRPRLADSGVRFDNVPRFDVNSNTRSLVIAMHEKTDVVRRLKGAIASLRGEASGDKEIAAYIRQSIALERVAGLFDAEKTLLDALQLYPAHVDLIAQLGILYSRWSPQTKANQAREQFERAFDLACRRSVMYKRWAQMEFEEKEYAASVRAASKGQEIGGESMELAFLEGKARSRLGHDLMRQRVIRRANEELEAADKTLFRVVRSVENDCGDLYRRSLRALWHNANSMRRERVKADVEDRWNRAFPDEQMFP